MVESARGCGFRQWHGVYFMSGSFIEQCDRGIIEIEPCECCGERPRFNRGISRINPYQLFGKHEILKEKTIDMMEDCRHLRKNPFCYMCDPPTHGFLDWVGKDNYTPESFLKEAHEQGISRRLPKDAIPVDFVVGKSKVYLAMQGLVEKVEAETVGDKGKKPRKIKRDGIFMAYIPTRIEKLFHAEEFTKHNMKAHDPKNMFDPENKEVCEACLLIEEMLRKNVTPVFVDPKDERFHKKSLASRKKKFQKALPDKVDEEDKEKISDKPDPKPKETKPSTPKKSKLQEYVNRIKSSSKEPSKETNTPSKDPEPSQEPSEGLSDKLIEQTKTYEQAMNDTFESEKEVDEEVIQVTPLTIDEKANKRPLPESIEGDKFKSEDLLGKTVNLPENEETDFEYVSLDDPRLLGKESSEEPDPINKDGVFERTGKKPDPTTTVGRWELEMELEEKEKSETIEIDEKQSEKRVEEITKEVWNTLTHEEKMKVMNNNEQAVELLNAKYRTEKQKAQFSEAWEALDKMFNEPEPTKEIKELKSYVPKVKEVVEEVENKKSKKPTKKKLKVTDPKDDFLTQEEEAMGLDSDFNESSLGSE
jgi:hypothetical protein